MFNPMDPMAMMQMGAGGPGGPMGDMPASVETNPEMKEFFAKHPLESDGLALTIEEKKEFILKYYSEDLNADEMVEKMMDEAELTLDKEIKEGKNKPPFSEPLMISVLTIAKVKILDELVEDVSKLYEERRKLVKGKEITDPGVIKITQINCNKMAMVIQTKIIKQAEEEAKSRNFPFEEFMNICAMMAMSDINTFVELEKIYNFRKCEDTKNQTIESAKLKEYIKESLNISEKIVKGEIDSTLVFIYPHLLSDKLYNLTGLESEQAVLYIRKLIKDNTIDLELIDLIIKEAYSIEKSKESCNNNFDNQMMDYEKQMMEAYSQRENQLKDLKDPMEDPAIKRMIEMGLINKEMAEEIIKAHQMNPGMMTPEMMMGMMPPGMMGMPPGMMGMSPEMMGMPPGMMGMPPGMMDPSMLFGPPPGMIPPQSKELNQKPPK